MKKIKLFTSIIMILILLSFTSFIKNQTRIIEKKIYNENRKISVLKKDLNETQLDFFYLSSPNYLSNKIKSFGWIEYTPLDSSRIYLTLEHFINNQRKISTINNFENEKQN